MIKFHVMALMFVGVGTMLLGQTQGCDVSGVFSVFPTGASDGSDDSPDQTDDGIDDSSGPTDDPDKATEIIYVAQLTGTSAENGNAEFRKRSNRMRLKVELEDAVPGSSHAIVVNGINIGSLTIGPMGEGQVEFDTKVERNHLPWPSEFPIGLQVGAVIQVGPAQGMLVAL